MKNNKFKNLNCIIKNKNFKFLLFFLLSILIFIILFIAVFKIINNKNSLEESVLSFANKNENIIFKIDKCIFFSSADTKNKTASVSNFTIENLYQYTDMAFFINNTNSENTLENTLKKLSISNIQYQVCPEQGEQNLYYKNLNNFAKSDIIDENKINDKLDFLVTSDDTADFTYPTLYNNCANPIVLSYINSNIKTDYTMTDTGNPLTYNGSLLKRCNVLLSNINCNLSFDIYITNTLDQEFKTTVFVKIPLQSDDNSISIYDGKYNLKQETNYIFYRYK